MRTGVLETPPLSISSKSFHPSVRVEPENLVTEPPSLGGPQRRLGRQGSGIVLVQKIYVGNLPFSAREADVESLFAQYGEVVSVAVPTDRETGRVRGFAFVEMSNEDATKAIAGLNGTDFGGRALNVNEAKPREGGGGGGRGYGGGGGGGGYGGGRSGGGGGGYGGGGYGRR
jgi:hypothetical protein